MEREIEDIKIMNLLSWVGFSSLLATALYCKLGCKGRTILWMLCRRTWHRAWQKKVREKKERREDPEENGREDPEENGREDEWEEADPKCD